MRFFPRFAEAVARSQNAEDDLAVVHRGTQMWKVRSFSKWFPRKYYVDSEDGKLKYEPSHKNNCIANPRYSEYSLSDASVLRRPVCLEVHVARGCVS